jgi:hypothetical protein
LRMVGAHSPTKIAASRLPTSLLGSLGVYPVVDLANRREVAAYPALGPKFGEHPFHALR